MRGEGADGIVGPMANGQRIVGDGQHAAINHDIGGSAGNGVTEISTCDVSPSRPRGGGGTGVTGVPGSTGSTRILVAAPPGSDQTCAPLDDRRLATTAGSPAR